MTINTGTLNVRLATPACGGGSGGRPPRPDEAAIIDVWSKRKLNSNDFSGGDVVAFVKQLLRLL